MAEQMEGTVVALRRFVGDAAHEIGTPLTALRADLELAEGAATTDDERRLIGRALGQADRLAVAVGEPAEPLAHRGRRPQRHHRASRPRSYRS